MFLAGVMKKYKEEVICDLAQYYNILDINSQPKDRLAIFVKGLPLESRLMKKLSKINYSQRDLLLAGIFDDLNLLIWSKTKDGQRNTNRPKRVTDVMLNQGKNKDIKEFTSGKEFEEKRNRIIKNLKKGG